jgi:hypothetical protein
MLGIRHIMFPVEDIEDVLARAGRAAYPVRDRQITASG